MYAFSQSSLCLYLGGIGLPLVPGLGNSLKGPFLYPVPLCMLKKNTVVLVV